MSLQSIMLIITVAATLIMSVIALATFCKDKTLAVEGKERIKEKTLLGLCACFGAVGALIGRIIAHHKTDKIYFSIVIWFSLIMQVALIVYLCYLAIAF